MSFVPPISANRSAQISSEKMLRTSLPFLSAFGYVISITALIARLCDGEEGISLQTVKYCLIGSSAPLATAIAITGVDAVKQLCKKGCNGAKEVVLKSIGPKGLIRRVIAPVKEFTLIGEACEEIDYARAKSIRF